MARTDAWMPLYTADYMGDTAHLTMEQSGSYLQLIMTYWRSGPLPADVARLAAICRMSRTHFARHVWPVVSAFFTEAEGRIFQKRIEQEREKAAKISDTRSKISKEKRWKKDGKTSGNGSSDPSDNNDLPIPNALPNGFSAENQLDAQGEMEETDEKPTKNRRKTASFCQNSDGVNVVVSTGYENQEDTQSPSSLRSDTITKQVSKEARLPGLPGDIVHFPGTGEAEEAVSLWNEFATKYDLPRVARLTETRRRQVLARLRECEGIEGWKIALEKVGQSSFMLGGGPRGWTASFDFMTQQSSFTKLMEDTYVQRRAAHKTASDDREDFARFTSAVRAEQRRTH
jgi:uncharacterized protein YdaU (DUF1376 family)